MSTIPIVDLFAGPGGLGEGFSSFNNGNTFKILVSAEMETSAHQTLKLRSFYRILKSQGGNALESYYQFCNGKSITPYDNKSLSAWKEAEKEAIVDKDIDDNVIDIKGFSLNDIKSMITSVVKGIKPLDVEEIVKTATARHTGKVT